MISKSWIPRTQKHLFANIAFPTEGSSESWKETFPDPSTSPAHYAKTLVVDCLLVATSGSWIRGFSRVEHLELSTYALDFDFDESATPFLPFHGFSPVIKSLRVVIFALRPSQVFNLILSSPLLEDLVVIIRRGVLAGDSDGSKEDITRRLLLLPGGIHFRNLTLTLLCKEDFSTTMALAEGCSHTLKSLDISDSRGTSVRYLRPHL